jgi:hypothetical protein
MTKRDPMLMEYVGVPPRLLASAIVAFHLRGALASAEAAGLDAIAIAALTQMADAIDSRNEPTWVEAASALAAQRQARSNAANQSATAAKPPVRRKEPARTLGKLVTRKQAAAILGISLKTVDRLVLAKQIRPTKRGPRGWMYDPAYLKGIDAAALLLRKRRNEL